MANSVTVLVGLPGSGKSTYSLKYPNSVVINQDILGTRNKCLEAARKALEAGKSIIIDRTNINESQRKHWIDLAKEFNVVPECIWFDTPIQICIQRANSRSNHPTFDLLSEEQRKKIIERFQKDFSLPKIEEGFSSITKVSL